MYAFYRRVQPAATRSIVNLPMPSSHAFVFAILGELVESRFNSEVRAELSENFENLALSAPPNAQNPGHHVIQSRVSQTCPTPYANDDDDDDNEPVWPTWALERPLQGCQAHSHQS
jgi:hypothetical protein